MGFNKWGRITNQDTVTEERITCVHCRGSGKRRRLVPNAKRHQTGYVKCDVCDGHGFKVYKFIK